jgi:hypothetical protein
VKIDFVQGGDRAIRGENSNAIAYMKLEQAATLKNGISYCIDVLYFYGHLLQLYYFANKSL